MRGTYLRTDLELLHRICNYTRCLGQSAAHALCDLRRSGGRSTCQLWLRRHTLPSAWQLNAHPGEEREERREENMHTQS